MKKMPMRTCALTREKHLKSDLIRIVRTPEGSVVIDQTGKINGRGVYLKKDASIILQAQQKKVLNHHLKTVVDDTLFTELLNIINK